MSEIKQINTGVAEIIAVKVPEGVKSFFVHHNGYLLYNKGCEFNLTIDLPQGNWTRLGLSTELTEEQCMYVMPVHELYCEWWKDYVNKSVRGQERCATAKEAFASLMQANGCYSKNPLGPDLCEHNRQCYDSCQGSCWTRADIDSEEWEQAEANTGTWLILKRLS